MGRAQGEGRGGPGGKGICSTSGGSIPMKTRGAKISRSTRGSCCHGDPEGILLRARADQRTEAS